MGQGRASGVVIVITPTALPTVEISAVKTTSKTRLTKLTRSDAQRFDTLKHRPAGLGYSCKGTLLKRMMKCGNKQCPCHSDPAKRHGPYFECTFKRDNKTVNVRIPAQAADLYRDAIRQSRKLRVLLDHLERQSRTALAHLAELKVANDN